MGGWARRLFFFFFFLYLKNRIDVNAVELSLLPDLLRLAADVDVLPSHSSSSALLCSAHCAVCVELYIFSSCPCGLPFFPFSEVLASSLVTGINRAMARLVDIWDSIGIMEDQRIERMQTVKKYIEVYIFFVLLVFCCCVLCLFVNHVVFFPHRICWKTWSPKRNRCGTASKPASSRLRSSWRRCVSSCLWSRIR